MAKTKKMTFKEFKAALAISGHDLEVFGFEGILNTILIAERALQEDVALRNPSSCLIEEYQKRIDATTELLEQRGYYK